jgi:DNA-binding MarR family transcriptional regulator
MKIESNLGYDFLQIANNYRNLLEKEVSKFGLHYAQISILSLLWETDGASQKRISDRLQLSQPTINKMVKSLARSGFVICNQCKKDGRKMRVYLTDKGREIEDDVLQAAALIQTNFFAGLTETERLILKQIFDKLRDRN